MNNLDNMHQYNIIDYLDHALRAYFLTPKLSRAFCSLTRTADLYLVESCFLIALVFFTLRSRGLRDLPLYDALTPALLFSLMIVKYLAIDFLTNYSKITKNQ